MDPASCATTATHGMRGYNNTQPKRHRRYTHGAKLNGVTISKTGQRGVELLKRIRRHGSAGCAIIRYTSRKKDQ